MNLYPLLPESRTLVLLDATAHDGESSLGLLEADDTHVSLIVLMHGRSSEALHAFADAEKVDLVSAASTYLDQVAERIAAPGRVVEAIVSGGSNPLSEIEYLASHTLTRRVLVPSSLPRQQPAGFERLTQTCSVQIVAPASTAQSADAAGGNLDRARRPLLPAVRRAGS